MATHDSSIENTPDADALGRFNSAQTYWNQEQPGHPFSGKDKWGSFLSWSWAAELSERERSLLARMERLDAMEVILRGIANSDSHGDGDDERMLRRMGRAMHCAKIACQATVLSHPWAAPDDDRWISEPEQPPPRAASGWARAARIERAALACAPWLFMGSAACCAIPQAAIPAAGAAFASLCLVFARGHMDNRPRNPHKQSLVSTIELLYPDLTGQGFFASARAQPNFHRHNPLASCEKAIDDACGYPPGTGFPSRRRSFNQLAQDPFPFNLSWMEPRAHSFQESLALSEASLPAPAPSRRALRM